jgi:hypothetical protein
MSFFKKLFTSLHAKLNNEQPKTNVEDTMENSHKMHEERKSEPTLEAVVDKDKKKNIIFISYRRDDTQGDTGRICDRLSEEFGKEAIFMDVGKKGIPLGVDFREYLETKLAESCVLLVMIGKQWLNITNQNTGKRRLDDPSDQVAFEITSAFDRKISVIPVLVQNASIPREKELPEKLKKLTYRNGISVRHEHFDSDINELINGLREYLPKKSSPEEISDEGEDEVDTGEDIESFHVLPILPVRGKMKLARNQKFTLAVGRPISLAAIEIATSTTDRMIAIASQKEASIEIPGPSDLFLAEVHICRVLKVNKTSEGLKLDLLKLESLRNPKVDASQGVLIVYTQENAQQPTEPDEDSEEPDEDSEEPDEDSEELDEDSEEPDEDSEELDEDSEEPDEEDITPEKLGTLITVFDKSEKLKVDKIADNKVVVKFENLHLLKIFAYKNHFKIRLRCFAAYGRGICTDHNVEKDVNSTFWLVDDFRIEIEKDGSLQGIYEFCFAFLCEWWPCLGHSERPAKSTFARLWKKIFKQS